MESGQSEETALRTIMLLALVGLLDSLYLSYLHHLVAGGGGCPTQDLPGLDYLPLRGNPTLSCPVADYQGWATGGVDHSVRQCHVVPTRIIIVFIIVFKPL